MKPHMYPFAAVLLAAAAALIGPARAEGTFVTGQTAEVRIVVPARNIVRGEVIGDSDLSYQMVAADRAAGGAVTTMDQLDGKQARRMLRAGESVRADDVRAPILVAKGATVTMTFSAPGISLSAVGRAMNEGGMGETVTVLNPVSYRQITATVTGAGTVAAGDISSTVASDQAPAKLAAVR